MIETTFKLFVKKNNFRLIFLVLVGLFISVTGFAGKCWDRDYVQVSWNATRDFIGLVVGVYDYSYGPKSEHGYLEDCLVEAAFGDKKYFKLMQINTTHQYMSFRTNVYLRNKLAGAKITFVRNVITNHVGEIWPEKSSSCLKVTPRTDLRKRLSAVSLRWFVEQDYKEMSYIRVSGKWRIEGGSAEEFNHIVYNLNQPDQNALKSNTQDAIMKEFEKDIVRILKDSEAIIVKGAELGANIKVYNTAGVELQSTVSKSDAVNIKLPAKQIYIVQIANSRYKVAM